MTQQVEETTWAEQEAAWTARVTQDVAYYPAGETSAWPGRSSRKGLQGIGRGPAVWQPAVALSDRAIRLGIAATGAGGAWDNRAGRHLGRPHEQRRMMMTQTPWRFPVSVESDQLAALVHQAGVLEETYGHRLSAWQAPSEEVAESVELLFELLFNSSAGTVVRYS